ncbi:MAG: protein kinase [Bryobacterales bacterium]|nr:protein kinase [Bryobacterales bacterium]
MQLPARFGKYELQKFLGGGMSHVYMAVDTVIGRKVAVKLLTDQGCMDAETKARFLSEAQISGNIVHDNIIRIHDYGEIDGRPYIVMEFLVGNDLRGVIDKGLAPDLRSQVNLALQGARAMQHVHKQGILHRDIKPDNLHVDESGRVRLMDFGIAKSQAGNLNLTREGFALGTPYYMAPEQVLGKPITPAADVYAFGIMLYELLTGMRPVVGDTVERLFYLILHQPLDLEPLLAKGVPQELISLIERTTSKKPEERVQSFDVVVTELENALRRLDGGTVAAPLPGATQFHNAPTTVSPVAKTAPPAEPQKAASSKMPMAAVAGVAAVVLAVGSYFLFKPEAERKDPPKKEDPAGPAARIQDAYGEMILLSEGSFLYGLQSEVRRTPAFYIDKREVSTGDYNKFAAASGKPALPDAAELPAASVNFEEAAGYCTWAGKHIPTGEEWERAARGSTGRAYPWGNEPDASKGNFKGNPNSAGKAMPVDSMPESATPEGLLHVAGNVWEWTRDPQTPSAEVLRAFQALKVGPNDPWMAIRGGGFDFDIRAAAGYEKNTVPAALKSPSVGFRCAKDVK